MSERIPVACTLTTKQAATQLEAWAGLRRRARSIEVLDDGVRLSFAPAEEEAARDLAAREAQCCAFLTLVVDHEGGVVTMTITGPEDAQPVIQLIARG